LPAFEVRFETPPGDQAQVDFAQFQVVFTDEPIVMRIVWLFSFVLGYSRPIWARFALHQDMQTVLRCHMATFQAISHARACSLKSLINAPIPAQPTRRRGRLPKNGAPDRQAG
jgi:transposase